MSDAADGRVFVDSNILIYAHDPSAGERYERARELIAGLWRSRMGRISVQVLQEFFVNLSRTVAVPEVRRLTNDFTMWRVHSPDAVDVIEAIDIHRDYQISFWDAMIVRSASELGCDVLWTEDLNDGQTYRGIRAQSPFA